MGVRVRGWELHCAYEDPKLLRSRLLTSIH